MIFSKAVNIIDTPESVRNGLIKGIYNVAKKICELTKENRVISIDAYPGTEYGMLIGVLRQYLSSDNVIFVDAKSILGIFSLNLLEPIEMTVHSDNTDDLFAALDRFIVK